MRSNNICPRCWGKTEETLKKLPKEAEGDYCCPDCKSVYYDVKLEKERESGQ